MKKSYYYLAVALVTAFTATASADQAPYRRASPYGGQPRYAAEDQQPLPLPPEGEQQPLPDSGCDPRVGCDPRMGQVPGVNVQGSGNTVIIITSPTGEVYRALAPQGCYNAYSCQALIGQLQPQYYQPIAPQWGCGYNACNVPTYYNNGGYGQIPLYGQYAYQGYQYYVYNPYGAGVARPAYGFYPQFRPQLRHPGRQWRR